MATIKPIEGRSVHQIQSGQVIVDLCSVVKELVENSLDAGATSVDVRFKNNGLESIEVQDNGDGIAPEDYETIALKHYTSKLSTYDDLSSLQTFGFRGEALSSLCALSKFHIITARSSDGPKGTRLEFEISGKLQGTSVVASQRGTTVAVENIFRNLPVRRRELEKNIKREYGKVLGLLHAYACISTGVRFAVSNQPAKSKKVSVFSTKANLTIRENIANVYGAKTLLALIPLDLKLEMDPTTSSAQNARNWATEDDAASREVYLQGLISRPVVGEGRQTPDRQMFFVNSRPCALPQVSKAINEVYKSYNVTQSPFIFANLKMDTNAYDVNVSPDKRTILLHDQTALLEALKASLLELFESHDQSVPQAVPPPTTRKLSVYRTLTINREPSVGATSFSPAKVISEADDVSEETTQESNESSQVPEEQHPPGSVMQRFIARNTEDRETALATLSVTKRRESLKAADESTHIIPDDQPEVLVDPNIPKAVQDFNARMGVQYSEPRKLSDTFGKESNNASAAMPGREEDPQPEVEEKIRSVSSTPQKPKPGVVQNAFDRMRPKRTPQETATITIGNQTTITTIGTPETKRRRIHTPRFDLNGRKLSQASPLFTKSLRAFAAPGTRLGEVSSQELLGEEDGDAESDTEDEDLNPTTSLPITKETDESDNVVQVDSAAHRLRELPLFVAEDETSEGSSGDEYVDDEEKKTQEEAKVAKMIAQAEEAVARPTNDNLKRATTVLRGRSTRKDSTLQLIQNLNTSISRIEKGLLTLTNAMQLYTEANSEATQAGLDEVAGEAAEERLSLTVSKSDFAAMRIVGQFNLGFILAMRPSAGSSDLNQASVAKSRSDDDLFIIDQHASDEKYNFERLQVETVVQNQRLVHPKLLELTAIEEELIMDHSDALAKNGFLIDVDTSGDSPVGQRCRLTSLPMSREVTFSPQDLEELLALLAEDAGGGNDIPRPSKVRKMFAMRACRSSIMIGKTLTEKQMGRVVRHMGEIDKPWNCPHGRPTMRHLFGMGHWKGWVEGDGLERIGNNGEGKTDWREYVSKGRGSGLLVDGDEIVERAVEDDPKDWLFTQEKRT